MHTLPLLLLGAKELHLWQLYLKNTAAPGAKDQYQNLNTKDLIKRKCQKEKERKVNFNSEKEDRKLKLKGLKKRARKTKMT